MYGSFCLSLAFHDADSDTDTDILADILARIVARMSACRSACHRNNFNCACRTYRRGSSRISPCRCPCRRRGMTALVGIIVLKERDLCVSVRVLVTTVSHAKTAEPTGEPFEEAIGQKNWVLFWLYIHFKYLIVYHVIILYFTVLLPIVVFYYALCI